MDKLINFLSALNIQTLVGIFIMLWYFSRHIENKIEQQSKRSDRLYEMFIDLLNERNNGH